MGTFFPDEFLGNGDEKLGMDQIKEIQEIDEIEEIKARLDEIMKMQETMLSRIDDIARLLGRLLSMKERAEGKSKAGRKARK